MNVVYTQDNILRKNKTSIAGFAMYLIQRFAVYLGKSGIIVTYG